MLATRAFRRLLPDHIPYLRGYLMVPNPRVIEYFDDIVFLFHSLHLLYHLPSRPYPSPWQFYYNFSCRKRADCLVHVTSEAELTCQSQTVTLACVTALASRASCRRWISSSISLRGIWGFMYGIREVLSPRSLKRFTFKDLFESQESQLNRRNETPTTNKIKGPRAALDSAGRIPTRRKIVLRTGATIRVRLATYIISDGPSFKLPVELTLPNESELVKNWPAGPMWSCSDAGSTGSEAPSVLLNPSLQ